MPKKKKKERWSRVGVAMLCRRVSHMCMMRMHPGCAWHAGNTLHPNCTGSHVLGAPSPASSLERWLSRYGSSVAKAWERARGLGGARGGLLLVRCWYGHGRPCSSRAGSAHGTSRSKVTGLATVAMDSCTVSVGWWAVQRLWEIVLGR